MRKVYTWGIVCLLTVSACMKSQEPSAEVRLCQNQVNEFRQVVDGRGRDLKKRAERICEDIDSLTNRLDRLRLLREMANVMVALSLRGCSVNEKENMEYSWCRIHECLALNLLRNGASEAEVGDLLLDGFKKYKEMCFSCGDENDYSDGNGIEARRRRGLAKGMKSAWINEACYFEQRMLTNIFGEKSPDAVRVFRERWHQEIGVFDESFVRKIKGK